MLQIVLALIAKVFRYPSLRFLHPPENMEVNGISFVLHAAL